MKKLYIIRHAKSCWDDPELQDIERPLNSKGFKDTPRIGKFLKNTEVSFDLLISSPAIRSLITAQLLAVQLNYSLNKIILEPSFYEFDDDGKKILESLLEILENSENNYKTIGIVGHNKTFEKMAQNLTDGKIDILHTCGVLELSFPIDYWRQIYVVKPEIDLYIHPKMLDQ